MLRYDPDRAPDRQSWLAADESERITAAQRWHERARVELPNVKVHAIFHVIVENQIAEDLECVIRAMPRLQKQGLSRHDALHAVGSVLAAHIYELLSSPPGSLKQSEVQARYNAEVERLSAKAWQAQGRE
jgi:hypothetical protein